MADTEDPSRESLEAALRCPKCRAGTISRDQHECDQCQFPYHFVGTQLRWGRANSTEPELEGSQYAYESGVRGRLRKSRFFPLLFRLLAPVLVTGPDPARRYGQRAEEGLVVDLGAGNDRRHPRFVNVDLLPFPNVDVVCDGETLPFRDSSVDVVVSIVTLEHVRSAPAVLSEVARILKPGGTFFIAIPFLQPFHAAPHDYRRWTIPGLEEDLRSDFEVEERGVYCGPFSTAAWISAELASLVLSGGQPGLRRYLNLPLQALFSPIKWFDLLASRLPAAHSVASAIYAEARRR